MRTNVLNAGYAPAAGASHAGRVGNLLASLKRRAVAQALRLYEFIDCPIETESDGHYAKSFMAVMLSMVFPPLLVVAIYQLLKAKEKEGGER